MVVSVPARLASLDASNCDVSWSDIDWHQPIGSATLPLLHYPQLDAEVLTREESVALGRLFTCFTCELFIHFEGYLIDYLRRYPARVPLLSARSIERFVREEELHRDAFAKLLGKLRPDLYPAGAPRFLVRRPSEDWVLSRLPPVSLFLLAMLFEEITLFVPQVIAEAAAGECAELVRQVMVLHARDESAHVGLDERVLRHARESEARGRGAFQVLLTLPALWFVDRRVAHGFRQLVAHCSEELELSPAARKHLLRRCPTSSDRLGTESFIRKLTELALPGGALLARALRSALC